MPLTRPKAAQVNFDVTNITDPLIRINSGESGSADKDTGIVMERGSDGNVALIYDESANHFAVINTDEVGTTSGNVTITSYADIKANAFYGDGSNLTGVSGAFTAESDGASLTDTSTGSSAGPVITLTRNPSDNAGSDADYIGQIKFKGDNDAGSSQVFAKITAKIDDASDGTEDGIIEIAHKKAGSNNISARFTSTDLKLINGTGLEVAGETTLESHLNMGDNDTIKLGTGGDFTIHHDGSNNIIRGTNAHNTWVQTDGNIYLSKKNAAEYMAIFYADAQVQLRYNNVTKFETTATGVSVNGTVDATSYTGDGSGLSGIATNSISQGDSSLSVTDSGTGVATLVLDNATHTTFNSSGITLASGVFSGTATSAQYADLAEIYTSDEDYEPGTVLIFGGDKEVTTTNIMHDHRVAGVVSTNPAHLMNSDADGIAVALRGRVPCKIDGPIRKGDIIVSGPVAGTGVALAKESAMPNAVCVIGKAIEENLDSGIKIAEIVV